MRKPFSTLAAAGAFAALMVVPAQVFAQQQQLLYGAIAYSPTTRAIGVASDNATLAEAEQVALRNCQALAAAAGDCKVINRIRNDCTALAVGADGGWGSHVGRDRATAERNALSVCAKYSTACTVIRRVCTSRTS